MKYWYRMERMNEYHPSRAIFQPHSHVPLKRISDDKSRPYFLFYKSLTIMISILSHGDVTDTLSNRLRFVIKWKHYTKNKNWKRAYKPIHNGCSAIHSFNGQDLKGPATALVIVRYNVICACTFTSIRILQYRNAVIHVLVIGGRNR